MMKRLIADDLPTRRASLSDCAPLFDSEHIRSVVTTFYKVGLEITESLPLRENESPPKSPG